MAELSDLAPYREEFTLPKGQKFFVGGLTMDDLIYLISAFPEMKALIDGKKKLVELSSERLMKMGPEVICAIIARGLGHREEGAVEKVRDFVADTQLRLLTKVIEVSFPEGVRPFVEALRSLSKSFVHSVIREPTIETEGSGTPSSEPISAQLQMDEGAKKHYSPLHVN